MTPGRISWSTTIIATCYFAMLQLWLGNSSEACSRTEETVQLATEDDWRALMPGMLFCKARHSYRLEKLNEVSPKSCCTKTWSCRLRGFSCLGRCYGSQALISQQADPMKDFITIDDALKLTQRTGTRVLDAEMLRLRGDLLLLEDKGAMEEAARCFRDAIAFARQQRAKSWELRATTSLARLLAASDRRDEARGMLADIYGWFTEGFDTQDLKAARTLLEELST